MKKALALLLVLALTFALPAPAYAAGSGGPVSLSWDEDYWDEDDDWDDYSAELESAIGEKMYSEWQGDSLPFWCWYDIDGDGIQELIVDNSNGTKGVETATCKLLNGYGSKLIITKGSFTVYYWDYATQDAESLRINSDNMFLSAHPDGYLVASTSKGNTETYILYGFFPQSTEMLSETYTLKYSGRELASITFRDSFGETSTSEDDWMTFLQTIDILKASTPLVFYQTS